MEKEENRNNGMERNAFILFAKCTGGGLLLFSLWFILGLFLTRDLVAFSIIAIIIYFVISQIYIKYLMGNLWTYIGEERGAHRLTATLGTIDRIIYAISFAFNQYAFIGVWLGIKIASRLINYRVDTFEKVIGDKTEEELKEWKEKKFKEEGEKRNVYIIGNAVSLFIGISVGFLIRIMPKYPIAFEFFKKII